MSLISNSLLSLSKGRSKFYLMKCCLGRLCFRGVVQLSSLSFMPEKYNSVPRHSLRPSKSHIVSGSKDAISLNYDLTTDNRTPEARPMCWDTTSIDDIGFHASLEKYPPFKDMVIPYNEMEKCLDLWRDMSAAEISQDPKIKISQASPEELIHYLRVQTNLINRQDFREACQLIAGRLPFISEEELLEVAKVIYTFPGHGGNSSILWEILDREFLRRLECVSSTDMFSPESNFFWKVMDTIYWLNRLQTSLFAHFFIHRLLNGGKLWFPQGVQLFFYTSVGQWKGLNGNSAKLLLNFLIENRKRCPFDVFLYCIDCFTKMHNIKQSIDKHMISKTFMRFLLSKSIENLEDDFVLEITTQFFILCPVKLYNKALNELFDKVARREDQVSCELACNIIQLMCEVGVLHKSCYHAMERRLSEEIVDPKRLSVLFGQLYGKFGPYYFRTLAEKVHHTLRTSNICSLHEGFLLQIFCILLDFRIEAFHLWELTLQGDIIVPNYPEKEALTKLWKSNSLHLIADDFIEVFCPNYDGSRLNSSLRKELYFELNESLIEETHTSNFIDYFQNLSKGKAVITDISPGLSFPGCKDVIVGVRSGKFYDLKHFDVFNKWDVKRPPPSIHKELSLCAIWIPPQSWSLSRKQMKHRLLLKLGYRSVMVDKLTWSLPPELRDLWVLEKLKLSKVPQ